MTSLAQWGINITLDEVPGKKKTVILKDVGHQEAVRMAIDTVKQLREKGIMDAVEILPMDYGNGVVYTVLRCRE